MTTPILVTGAAGRVGAVGRTVTELLLPSAMGKRRRSRSKTWHVCWPRCSSTRSRTLERSIT
jgi:hypothetical protein